MIHAVLTSTWRDEIPTSFCVIAHSSVCVCVVSEYRANFKLYISNVRRSFIMYMHLFFYSNVFSTDFFRCFFNLRWKKEKKLIRIIFNEEKK